MPFSRIVFDLRSDSFASQVDDCTDALVMKYDAELKASYVGLGKAREEADQERSVLPHWRLLSDRLKSRGMRPLVGPRFRR